MNGFGDPKICTLIATRSIEIDWTELALEDQSGAGRRVLSLEAN